MKRLTSLLNYLQKRGISIAYIHYDDESRTTLITISENADYLLEIDEDNFVFYDKQKTIRMTDITTKDILEYLDGNL